MLGQRGRRRAHLTEAGTGSGGGVSLKTVAGRNYALVWLRPMAALRSSAVPYSCYWFGVDLGEKTQAGQFLSSFEAETDVALAAGVNDPLQPLVVPFAGNADVVELPASRAQRLFDRVQTVQNLHLLSLTALGVSPYQAAGPRDDRPGSPDYPASGKVMNRLQRHAHQHHNSRVSELSPHALMASLSALLFKRKRNAP